MRGVELDEEREHNRPDETPVSSVEPVRQRTMSMSQRFVVQTTLIALPGGFVAGLIVALVLTPEKTAAKLLLGGVIGLVLTAAILALALGAALARFVLPLEKLGKFSKYLMVRDFSHEVDLGKRSELRTISHAINTMLRSVRDVVDQMHDVSDNLADSSGLMATVAKETSDAVSATSSTIAQLARGAEDQASSMMVASSTISQMAEEIDRVAAASREVAKYSVEARSTVEGGAEAVGRATEKMGALVETTGISAQAVRNLGERSEQIGLIVDVITDIADQTNLLALNAAIEAARAGEHGKGFAVVAGEVRKLAEGSARAGSQIAQIIREIQRTINETVVLMEDSTKEAGEGAVVVGDTGEALERIKSAVETIGAETNAISEATDSIADGSAKVVEIISSVASISEESSSGTQEVSASIEEQTASMQEITAAAMELAETAERLRGLIDDFSSQ
jgi:methyl-accepting chemotaxis protein